MSRIPDDVLQAIREATDLVDLIGGYTAVKRSGKGYKARCPLHGEKTPSFHIWPETGTWRCFGCGKGGNAFTFLQEKEGLTFPESFRRLAAEAGIVLEAQSPAVARLTARKDRVREACEWACCFFQAALRSPKGAGARGYLERRGITAETIERFRLGYSPDSWDKLLLTAQQAGFTPEELEEAGLVIARAEGHRRGAGMYDRFRDRLMFPICDRRAHVIAFGARALGDAEPKYLNSPETPVFTKGEHVYALHLAKDLMMQKGAGAVMEGYTDVIMTHQAGWPAAVAGLGTALTAAQASLLSRFAKERVYLVYDGDQAGLRAAERAIPVFLPADVETRVVVLPPGEDPCDLISKQGLPAFQAHLDRAREAFDHLLAMRMEAHDASTVPGRERALDDSLQALAGVENQVRRALYAQRAADALSVPEELVLERLKELTKKEAERRRRLEQRSAPSPRSRAPRSSSAPGRSGPARSGPGGTQARGSTSAGRPPRQDSPAAPAQPGSGGSGAHGAGSHDDVPWDAYSGAAQAGDEFAEHAEYVPGAGSGQSSPPPPASPPPPDVPPPSGARASGPVSEVERQLLEAAVGDAAFLAEAREAGILEDLAHPRCRALFEALGSDLGAGAGDVDDRIGALEDPELASFAVELRASGEGKNLLPQGQDCLTRLRGERNAGRLHEEFRRAKESGDAAAEDEALRRQVEFHRRRSRGE